MTTARFDGWCGSCKKPIREGDAIERDETDAWRHADCRPVEDETLATTHPVCSTCWLTHPEGACDR